MAPQEAQMSDQTIGPFQQSPPAPRRGYLQVPQRVRQRQHTAFLLCCARVSRTDFPSFLGDGRGA